MSARPDTNPTDQAEAEKPVTERPIGRRTMLRAAILTVPVVAAFSRNAYAATDGHGCQLPTFAWCSFCQTCLRTSNVGSRDCGCTTHTNGNHGCSPDNAATCRAAGGHARVVGENNASSLTSPFNANQSAINDGGFNASPWK